MVAALEGLRRSSCGPMPGAAALAPCLGSAPWVRYTPSSDVLLRRRWRVGPPASLRPADAVPVIGLPLVLACKVGLLVIVVAPPALALEGHAGTLAPLAAFAPAALLLRLAWLLLCPLGCQKRLGMAAAVTLDPCCSLSPEICVTEAVARTGLFPWVKDVAVLLRSWEDVAAATAGLAEPWITSRSPAEDMRMELMMPAGFLADTFLFKKLLEGLIPKSWLALLSGCARVPCPLAVVGGASAAAAVAEVAARPVLPLLLWIRTSMLLGDARCEGAGMLKRAAPKPVCDCLLRTGGAGSAHVGRAHGPSIASRDAAPEPSLPVQQSCCRR